MAYVFTFLLSLLSICRTVQTSTCGGDYYYPYYGHYYYYDFNCPKPYWCCGDRCCGVGVPTILGVTFLGMLTAVAIVYVVMHVYKNYRAKNRVNGTAAEGSNGLNQPSGSMTNKGPADTAFRV